MITDATIGNVNNNRDNLLNHISSLKNEDPNFTVVDVGGSVAGWSAPVVDYIVDINPPEIPTDVRVFCVNLNKQDDWKVVLDHVEENGKFSFAICSHTLEDLANPTLTMDMLPRIANAGYVAVPSKYTELSKIEGNYRGYIHHRWIYDFQDEKFIGFPKLSFIEYETELHKIADSSPLKGELSFLWKDSFEYEIINNDYMGPDVTHVKQYYRRLLL
jgi:hypothetical protein